MAEPADDLVVEAVLADLARVDEEVAAAARAGFESLTWGEGLAAVTGHALADFLWYQLPTKWLCDLDEKRQVAAALGELFQRLGRTRYADMCCSAATAGILATYEHDGGTAGFKAYRSALAASGLQPSDLPGGLEWGSEYRGYVQYYQMAGNISWLNKLRYVMERSMMSALAAKYRRPPWVMRRRYESTVDTPYGKRRCFEATQRTPNGTVFTARLGGIPLRRRKHARLIDGAWPTRREPSSSPGSLQGSANSATPTTGSPSTTSNDSLTSTDTALRPHHPGCKPCGTADGRP